MTASEPSRASSDDRDRSLAERVLDVFVYLPAGALLTALEDMPETVAKGRARVGQELHNAKVVGRFAVGLGWRQVRGQIESLGAADPAAGGTRPEGPDEDRPGKGVRAGRREVATDRSQPDRHQSAGGRQAASRSHGSRPHASRPVTPRRPPRPPTPPRDTEVDRAIPDYDVLAASQVVRRLDGLGPAELAAVARHERATRARRTILARAEQLLGARGQGGPAAPGSDTD